MPSKSRTAMAIIDDIAWAQGGLISAHQLAEAAVPSSTTRYRIRSGGPWRRVLPTVYQVAPGPLSPSQREQAALLYAGSGAILTGLPALRRHGIRYLPGDAETGLVHLLVSHERRPRSVGFALIERTERLPETDPSHNLPTAPLVRAVVDGSRRCLDRRSVRALASEVVQSGLVSLPELHEELVYSQRRGSALLRDTLADLASGTRSAPEAELRDLILSGNLPEPLWNPTLTTMDGRFLCVPDAYYPEHGVALEMNSHEFHGAGEAFEATEMRQARMASHGLIVVTLTPRRVRRDGQSLLRDIRATLRSTEGRPLPAVLVGR